MISRFDTYSEIMPVIVWIVRHAKYSKCQQFQDMGGGFFGLNL